MAEQEIPLAPFTRLVGGTWHMDDSKHEFFWQVGRKAIGNRSYFMVDGEYQLVSEGAWYWHPGEGVLRGYAKNL